MADISPNALIESAALAATSGQKFRSDIVRMAVRLGLYTAQHGHPFSLPLLLDVCALMTSPPPFNPLIREFPEPPPKMAAYDSWLLRFCEHAWKSFGTALPSDYPSTFSPLLMSLWPRQDQETCLEWVSAYQALTGMFEDIARIWCHTPRSPNSSLWGTWLQRLPHKLESAHAPYLWGRFDDSLIHERFDHVAAQLYVEAPSLRLHPYVERLIRRLERQRQNVIPPYPESHEELNPWRGPLALDTLTQSAEYVMRKLADGGGTRLSNLVSSMPDQIFSICLYWVNGYNGLKTTAASILQALAVILIDDWRFVLQTLPVHLHAYNANLPSLKTFYPGPRWDPSTLSETAVNHFFKRPNWAAISTSPLQWSPLSANWACICLLATDLAEFGLRRQETPAGIIWVDSEARLPEWVSNIIIIETEGELSHVCKITQTKSQTTAIVPLPWPNWLSKKQDTVFHSLRERILEVLIKSLIPYR